MGDELSSVNQNEKQQKSIIELERDDMVQLYKELVEESQNQQKTIKTLNLEKEETLKKLSDYTIRNKALIDAEEKALAAARQEGLNVVTLKHQVSDLCERLQELTKETEEKLKKEREYEQEIFVSSQAAREIEMRKFNLERDLASAKGTVERQQQELGKLENDITQEKHLTRLERDRNAKLEALLAEFRRKELGVDGANANNKDSVSGSTKDNKDALNASTASNKENKENTDVATLYKTLEQQYSLIGEMDQEIVGLQGQNKELKEKLAILERQK